MKKQITLLTLILLTLNLIAQTTYQDVVYLKNGSVIRGTIIEQIINKSIKIETADKSLFVFTLDEIEKLTKEEIKTNLEKSKSNSHNKKSSITTIDLGYQIGIGYYGIDRLRLNITTAYQLNSNFSFGGGTGLRYYNDYEATLIPLFLNIRRYLTESNVKPYIQVLAGYSFDASNDWKGVGLIINPELGLTFKTNKKTSINIGIGYEIQQIDFISVTYYRGSPTYSINKENSGALSVIAGITF